MNRKRFILPVATAGATAVEVIGHRYGYVDNGAGDLALALLILEVVWVCIQIGQWIFDKITGKKKWVKRLEWRGRERERIVAYRPEQDRKHPHYRRAA